MVRGAWCMVRGAWCVVRGAWCVVRGAWCVMSSEVSVVRIKVLHSQSHRLCRLVHLPVHPPLGRELVLVPAAWRVRGMQPHASLLGHGEGQDGAAPSGSGRQPLLWQRRVAARGHVQGEVIRYAEPP